MCDTQKRVLTYDLCVADEYDSCVSFCEWVSENENQNQSLQVYALNYINNNEQSIFFHLRGDCFVLLYVWANNCATNLYWTKLNASHDHQNDKQLGNGNTKTYFTISNNFKFAVNFQFVILLHLTYTQSVDVICRCLGAFDVSNQLVYFWF